MSQATPNIIKLAIPHELSGMVVRGYVECGDYITPETAAKREASKQKRLKRLQIQLDLCKSKTEQRQIEGAIKNLELHDTQKGNRTNRDKKAIGVFITLKAITSSGIISSYREQVKLLEQYTKKNLRSIEHYLEYLNGLGLATITGRKGSHNRNIQLGSWKQLCEVFDISFTKEFTLFSYDLNNPLQAPEYVLDGAEEAEKQERLYSRLIRKINTNHIVKKFLATHYNIIVKDAKGVDAVQALRESWYTNGLPDRSCSDPEFEFAVTFLYQLNTCTGRKRTKIQDNRNYLQPRRVSYLRKALAKREVSTGTNLKLTSNQNRVPDRKVQANGYDALQKRTIWYMPTKIDTSQFTIKTKAST